MLYLQFEPRAIEDGKRSRIQSAMGSTLIYGTTPDRTLEIHLEAN